MKKPASIQITIPEPCTQDWSDMQPIVGGRHCAHCQKAVVDFNRMTDARLLAYFQKPGAAYGRFAAEQLDRVIKVVEIPRSTCWARVAVVLLLSLMFVQSTNGQVRYSSKRVLINTQTPYGQTCVFKTGNADTVEYFRITAVLKDEDGNVFANANVRLELEENRIVCANGITDSYGECQFKIIQSNKPSLYTLIFSHLAEEVVVTNISNHWENAVVTAPFTNPVDYPDNAVLSFGIIHRTIFLQPPGQRTIKGEMLDHIH